MFEFCLVAGTHAYPYTKCMCMNMLAHIHACKGDLNLLRCLGLGKNCRIPG
jgi:hypothetical protein